MSKIFELLETKSIEATLSNLPQGEAVVLDIDDTLLRNPTTKYDGDTTPTLTEAGLVRLFNYAMIFQDVHYNVISKH